MQKIMVIILLGLLTASLGCSKADKPPEVTKVLIHYIGWNILTRVDQSCQDLVNHGDSVVVTDQFKINQFATILRELQLTEMPDYNGIDARICLRLYSSDSTAIKTISISHTRLMEIDGHVYELDTKLFDLIVSYLPKNYLTS
jgi:hypothetical protein